MRNLIYLELANEVLGFSARRVSEEQDLAFCMGWFTFSLSDFSPLRRFRELAVFRLQ